MMVYIQPLKFVSGIYFVHYLMPLMKSLATNHLFLRDWQLIYMQRKQFFLNSIKSFLKLKLFILLLFYK